MWQNRSCICVSQNWVCVFPGGGGFPFPSLVTKKARFPNVHLQLYCVQFSPFQISHICQGPCCLYVVLWSLDMYEQQPKTSWTRLKINIMCILSVYIIISSLSTCLHVTSRAAQNPPQENIWDFVKASPRKSLQVTPPNLITNWSQT